MTALLSARVLNHMRRRLYGSNALLTFYRIVPNAVEEEIASLNTDWYAQIVGGAAPGTVKIVIAETAQIQIANLLENAIVDLIVKGQTKRYRVVGLTETQQLGAGWVIHAEPMSGTI